MLAPLKCTQAKVLITGVSRNRSSKKDLPRCSRGPALTAHPLPPRPFPVVKISGQTPSLLTVISLPTASLMCSFSASQEVEAFISKGNNSWTAYAPARATDVVQG